MGGFFGRNEHLLWPGKDTWCLPFEIKIKKSKLSRAGTAHSVERVSCHTL